MGWVHLGECWVHRALFVTWWHANVGIPYPHVSAPIDLASPGGFKLFFMFEPLPGGSNTATGRANGASSWLILCGCMFVSSSWGRQYRMTDNPQWCSIHLKLWFRLAISVSMYKSQHVHYSLDLPPLRMYIELLRYIEGDQFGYKSTEISCLKSSNAPESVITPLGRPCSRPELYRTPSSWRRSGSPPRTGIWTGPQPVGVKWAVTKTGDDWG